MYEARIVKEQIKQALVGVDGVSGIAISWNDQGKPVVLVNVASNETARIIVILAEKQLDRFTLIEEIDLATQEIQSYMETDYQTLVRLMEEWIAQLRNDAEFDSASVANFIAAQVETILQKTQIEIVARNETGEQTHEYI
jgi:hypothetical protein